MKTNPKVVISQKDNDIQSGIVWSSSENKSFGDLSLLNVSGKESPNFETLELNEYILNSQLVRGIDNISFMSESLSDDECLFDNVWVEATLSAVSDIAVTSIEFGNNYPKKVSIEKYLNDVLIGTETIDNIDNKFIFSKEYISGANKLKINFLESWAPYQYANLQSWIVGGDIIFSGDDISELTLNENTDPISNRLEIDTAHISILDKYNNFNLLKNDILNKFVKIGTEVKISVNIYNNGEEKEKNLGRYYIKDIKFDINHSMILECETFLGLMDKIKFPGFGQIIFDYDTPISLCNLKLMIDRIFEGTLNYLNIDLSKRSEYYEIVDDLSETRVYGYIPIITCRDALRHLAFVHNLTISDNRSDKIIIKKYSDVNNNLMIEKERITSFPTIENNELVSSASMMLNRYSLSNETKEIIKIQKTFLNKDEDYVINPPFRFEYYEATDIRGNQITVNFFHTMNVIILNGTYPILFELKIFGKEYSNQGNMYTRSFNVPEGNNIQISESGLVTSSNINEVIENYVSFVNNNYIKIKIEYINIDEETGKNYTLELPDNKFVGYLTYQSLDVAHGMVANAEFIGKLNTDNA